MQKGRESVLFGSAAGRGVAALLMACGALSASATTYYSKESGTKNVSIEKAITWCTNVTMTTAADPQPTPAADDGNEYVFVKSSKLSSSVFAGKAYFGCDGTLVGSSAVSCGINCNHATFDFSDLTLVRGYWACNADTRVTFTGAMAVAPGCSFEFRGASSAKNKSRGVTVQSTLTGAANSVLAFKDILSPESAAGADYSFGILTIAGDASSFKGKYSVSHSWLENNPPDEQWSEICLASASAFGDPTVAATNAITLNANTYLSMYGEVAQTSARGITLRLAASEEAGVRANAGTNWTLTAPVVCAAGTFTKTGAGTVHLAGSVSAANVAVRAGTLVLDSTYTASEGQSIAVDAGATLILGRSASGLSITCAEGGAVKYATVTVPYDAATTNATAQTIPADYTRDFPIPVALSEKITLPFVETNRLLVLTIQGGTYDVSRFTDVSPKTCALPTTWFESEIDAATGVQSIYLVAKPVLNALSGCYMGYAVHTASSKTYYSWTDHLADHAGADYYGATNMRTRNGSNMETLDFPGDSLTLANGGNISDYARVLKVDDCRVYGANSAIVLVCATTSSGDLNVNGPRERGVYGSFYIAPGATNSVYRNNTTNRAIWAATLTGTGTLKLTGTSVDAKEGTVTPFKLYDMSPDFTGGIFVYVAKATREIDVGFTNSLAFGGSPSVFTPNAVFLSTGVTYRNAIVMTAENDVEVTDQLRGWTVVYGTFRTPAGVTWKMTSPLKVTKELVKDGAGTLALGTDVTGAGTTLPIVEGYVQPLVATCCTNLDLVVSDGAGLRVAIGTADDVTTYGLRAKSITPETETAKIAVKIDAPESFKEMTATVALCTVPADQADLSEVLTVKPPRGYAFQQLTKTELTGDDAGYVRYTADIKRRGLVFYLK